jgi:hypothetical protein
MLFIYLPAPLDRQATKKFLPPMLALLFLRWTMRLPALPGDTNTFPQLLDHFNTSSTETFPQRYVVNDTFCRSPGASSCPRNSPIILYISGESPMSTRWVSSGNVVDLAIRTHALLASLEHRFYGSSIPFDLTTSVLSRYLTTQQALADLAFFVDFLKGGNSARPVIVVGGSYAGTLSTYFRQTYPNHANWSWSSSPPLLVKLNFTEYDEHCAEVLRNQTDYPNCLANSVAMVKWFDEVIKNDTQREMVRMRMGLNRSTDPISMVSMVSDQLAGMIQYRSGDGGQELREYCRNQSGPSFDVESFFEWFRADNLDPDENDPLLLTNTSGLAPDADYRAWTWQTCNEYGWFQTASGKLRSASVNLSYYDRICRTIFDDLGVPDQTDLRRRFGGLKPNVSNIVFVNGGIDPWSTLSVPTEGNITEYHWYSVKIYSGSHCSELSRPGINESAETTQKRELVLRIMTELVENGTRCVANCAPSGHGHCELGACMCDSMWGGDWCQQKQIDVLVFQISAGAMVGLPAIMMIVIGCSAWFLFQADGPEGTSRSVSMI